MPPHRLTRALAGALAATALAGPAAVARPIDTGPVYNLPAPSRSDAAARAPTVIRTIDDGFDWGSAAIGAGGAIGLVAVATGAGLTLRRRQVAAPSRLNAR